MIVLLFDTDSFGHKAVSNLWFFWEPFGATLWKPLENRFSKNRTPPRVPRPWLDWKFHYCGKMCLADLILSKTNAMWKIVFFEWSPPLHTFWHSFWHTIWTYLYIIAYLACFGILSDIPSGILFGFSSDLLSGILCVWHIFMTFFLAFYLVYLRRLFVVEVRRGTLWSAARGWGPAGNTLTWGCC